VTCDDARRGMCTATKFASPARATVGTVSEQQSLFALPAGDVVGSEPIVDVEDDAPVADLEAAERPPEVEVVRSTRRRRTVSAHREGDRIIVSIPARISRKEESRWVALMVERVLASERKLRPSDDDLSTRAAELSTRYLGSRATATSVQWVDNMAARWGSCTPVDGTIRLSRRLVGMPTYVVDYVLLHELTHLLVPGHGPTFWKQLAGYERLERARGFLEGVGAVQDT
jgi:predicted metal-dependent hydrolase